MNVVKKQAIIIELTGAFLQEAIGYDLPEEGVIIEQHR